MQGTLCFLRGGGATGRFALRCIDRRYVWVLGGRDIVECMRFGYLIRYRLAAVHCVVVETMFHVDFRRKRIVHRNVDVPE